MLFILLPLISCRKYSLYSETPLFYIHKNQTKYLNQQSISLITWKFLKVEQKNFKSGQYFTAVFFLELVMVEDYVDDHNAHTYFHFSCVLAIPKKHFKPECCYGKYSRKNKVSSMYGNSVHLGVCVCYS